jgi:hypothetical protein
VESYSPTVVGSIPTATTIYMSEQNKNPIEKLLDAIGSFIATAGLIALILIVLFIQLIIAGFLLAVVPMIFLSIVETMDQCKLRGRLFLTWASAAGYIWLVDWILKHYLKDGAWAIIGAGLCIGALLVGIIAVFYPILNSFEDGRKMIAWIKNYINSKKD